MKPKINPDGTPNVEAVIEATRHYGAASKRGDHLKMRSMRLAGLRARAHKAAKRARLQA